MTIASTEGSPPGPEEAEDNSTKTKEDDKRESRPTVLFNSALNFIARSSLISSINASQLSHGGKSSAGTPATPRKKVPESARSGTRRKSALKAFDKYSLAIDKMSEFSLASSKRLSERSQSEEGRADFLVEYGLSKVMRKRVLSKCSKIYCMTVLLDNGPWMKVDDAKVLVGQKKGTSEGLPEDARLVENTDYDRCVETGQRLEGAKDASYFFIKFAATMSLPITLELFSFPRDSRGSASRFRQIGTTALTCKKGCAQDWLPLFEQVESANDLIDEYSSRLASVGADPLKQIELVKKFYEKETAQGCLGGDVMVTIYTSHYPWGNRGSISDIPAFTDNFVNLMNEFVDLPVTFLFIVDTQEQNIINFYDSIVKAETKVRAKVQVAKGLGCMIDGINKYNPWLNYSLPMHICQILGICSDILSQSASRPLNESEVWELCNTLIGDVPNPAEDVDSFVDTIKGYMENDECKKWSPVSGEESPLIDIIRLKKHLSKNSVGLAGLIVATLVCIIAIIVGMSLKE